MNNSKLRNIIMHQEQSQYYGSVVRRLNKCHDLMK